MTELVDVAVLWDLDGLLIDSERLFFEAERAVFADYGIQLTEAMKQPFIGLGGHEVMARMADAFGVSATVEALDEAKFAHIYRKLPGISPFPQTKRLLELLSAEGVPMAVASGASPEMIMVAMIGTGIGKHISERVSALEVARGKPAPDVFLEAARRLGVERERCVVIEDAVPGILAAKAAGMRCIAIPSVLDPWDARFKLADHVVRGGMPSVDPEGLKNWILTPTSRATA